MGRKRPRAHDKDDEERRLERLVFNLPLDGGGKHGEDGGDAWTTMAAAASDDEPPPAAAAAWQDEDDDRLRVDISARARLRKLRQTPEEAGMAGSELERRLRARFQQAQAAATHAWAHDNPAAAARKNGGRDKIDGSESDSDEQAEQEEGDEEREDDDDAAAAAAGAAAGAELLADSARLVAGRQKSGSGGKLPTGRVDIVRCKDANIAEPAKAAVRAVSFHPTAAMLLAAGWDKTARLFQVDGEKNRKVASVFLADLPVSQAAFTTPLGEEAIVAGPRPFFYWIDVAASRAIKVPRVFSAGSNSEPKRLERFAASPDGQWLAFAAGGGTGEVLLLSRRTKQWAADLKLNAPAATALAFSPDSSALLAAGSDGQVYRFDVRSRRCVMRFYNEGGTAATSLAISPGERFTAVGSDSGVVNLYDAAAMAVSGGGGGGSSSVVRGVRRPLPHRAVMNLTTAATEAVFSGDGQLLAIASREKRDALKLVHLPSCTVFSNWPTQRTPIRYPYSLALSPSGGYLAVGNDRGCVLLYRVKHYPQF